MEFILDELLKTEDFRKYEKHWRYMWYARKFIEENLPFWEMHPADELVVNEDTIQIDIGDNKTFKASAEVFAKPGNVYAAYLPTGIPSGKINLDRSDGDYSLRWYNPRTGKFEGEVTFIKGGKQSKIGLPPRQQTQDWVVLIKKKNEHEESP